MPEEVEAFLDGITLAEIITWLIAAGVIFAGVKWVVPFARKITNFIDDVAGEPARPGIPARPGLMERLGSVEEKQTQQGVTLETVRHELFPNSGKSLRDQTNRMEQKLDRDNDRITELAETVDGLTSRVDEHITQSTQIINKLSEEES